MKIIKLDEIQKVDFEENRPSEKKAAVNTPAVTGCERSEHGHRRRPECLEGYGVNPPLLQRCST